MAPAGQAAEQLPQPIQTSVSSAGSARPPSCRRKRMASCSQLSWHTRQLTPFIDRQLAASTCARHGHWATRSGNSASVGHAWAQSPHRVQPSAEKSRVGKPPSSNVMTFSGQAEAQSSQRVHRSAKSETAAPGGRIASRSSLSMRALRKARLLVIWLMAGDSNVDIFCSRVCFDNRQVANLT